MNEELLNIVYVDTSDFACTGGVVDTCNNRERTISFATFVKIPDEPIVPGLQYKECCYETLVLADDSGKLHKNDFTGFYYSRQIGSETCTYVLIDKQDGSEYPISDDTYGIFKPFGAIAEQPNLSTFIVQWNKILSALGEGAYQIRKDISITGISYSELSSMFTLRTFSDFYADKTIRIDIKMDGFMELQNVDFTGTNYKSSLRVGGFFGRREPKYEEDNLVFRTKKIEQISMKMVNAYKLQTELLPECVTEQIFDFYLFADEIFLNDYNLNNHSYSYKNKAVDYENNEGTKYYTENRKARLNLLFKDRYANRNKINY